MKRFLAFVLTALLLLSCIGCDSQEKQEQGYDKKDSAAALVPHLMDANQVVHNPYLAQGESIIHNDTYSSDVTAQVVPLGIYPEIVSSTEAEADKAVPCFFYDSNGNCITPYSLVTEKGTASGGIAVRDVNSSPVKTLGSFLPVRDDKQQYGIQISYSFVDNNGLVVGPTTHGHVLMMRTADEKGNVLPTFEKALDVDIVTAAKKALGDDIDPNLLSMVMDYSGNLWFVTGGFHIDPAYAKDGFLGYLDRSYIDAALSGKKADVNNALHFYRLKGGEGAENGISSHPDGCVILTNKACYLLNASQDGVQIVWRTEYQSDGGKGAQKDSGLTGAGLAWGGGSTPTLSEELVLFTDNQNPVELLALDIKTGKIAAQQPVFERLKNITVSVENSIIVYSHSADSVSALICNWYGAGNAGLFEKGADSSVQSYDNLYDENWIANGSKNLMPGIERIDTVKKNGTYTMKSVWTRGDLCDTSMFKLSTSTGYLYGYTQENDGVWKFMALDWETGKTVMEVPVSALPRYNNMAVGMMQGNNGNSLYCPTNNMELLRLQDRFAYLPEKEFVRLNMDRMERARLTTDKFRQVTGTTLTPVSYLHTAAAENIYEPTVLAYRINGLSGTAEKLRLFIERPDGSFTQPSQWKLTDESGKEVDQVQSLSQEKIYEARITIDDGGDYDLDETKGTVRISMILGS